jgi:hypothetical protein
MLSALTREGRASNGENFREETMREKLTAWRLILKRNYLTVY